MYIGVTKALFLAKNFFRDPLINGVIYIPLMHYLNRLRHVS